jgi:zinc D-Ala-D-Ala dipeptidase
MKLTDVTKYKFVAEPRYYFFGWSDSPIILGQDHILKALVKARALLPKGYNFKIWDMARPRPVQLKMRAAFKRQLAHMYSGIEAGELTKLIDHFAAKPLVTVVRPDTHRNGGALDLTIINAEGEELYMGTDHDSLTPKAAANYFELKKNLTPIEKLARDNRRLLRTVLLTQKFENYAPEWWHWSRV